MLVTKRSGSIDWIKLFHFPLLSEDIVGCRSNYEFKKGLLIKEVPF